MASRACDIIFKLLEMAVFKDPKLIKAVEKFVFTNDQKYIGTISKFKIPNNFKTCTVPLFRGMFLDNSIVDDLKGGGSLTISNYTSWTIHEKMAMAFVKDSKKRVGGKASGVGIVCKKKIPDSKVVLNIQSLFMFLENMGMLDQFGIDPLTAEMGVEEGEVLCDKGLVLTKRDIHRIVSS